MAVLSTFLRSLAKNTISPKNGASASAVYLLRPQNSNALQVLRQMSEHRTMKIKPSRWQWNKFKEILHFYILLGVIPCTLVILYTNIFIGPARLVEIPEGYVPEAHEYQVHPITRWLTKHVHRSYQQEYETMCQHIYEQSYKQKLRKAEHNIKQKMLENQDTQAYYYQPVTSRYHKFIRESTEKTFSEDAGSN